MTSNVKKENEDKGQGLVEIVFSWTIEDVVNADLYRNKVKQIPDRFLSSERYFKSFICPLIEETHADLQSNFMTVDRAPGREIVDIRKGKKFELPKKLNYKIQLKPELLKSGPYEPEYGDLIALTEVKPKRIDDLNGPKRSYLIALVEGKDEDSELIKILSSKPIEFKKEEPEKGKQRDKIFAVYLTNLTTNIRIWTALHTELSGGNMKMIDSVLRGNPMLAGDCNLCSSEETGSSKETIDSMMLDDSQKNALLNCIATTACHHRNNVKLIWGPPGTGKTKTISSLVLCLLRMNHRTLTCAPTNVAVIGIAKRLMSLLSCTLEFEAYGLGDVVLFGNGERMKVDDHEDLYDVFLDYRVWVLAHCFAPLTGWNGSLNSMISLLEDPESQYQQYKVKEMDKNKDDSDDSEEDDEKMESNEKESKEVNRTSKGKYWNQIIAQELKKAKKKNRKKKALSHSSSEAENGKKDCNKKEIKEVEPSLTFEEYFRMRFSRLIQQLGHCVTGLYTHMPTSYLSYEVVKNMIRVLEMLHNLHRLIHDFDATKELLREGLNGNERMHGIRIECLRVLKILKGTYSVPNFFDYHQIRNFCLQNACLIFCTASSSAKLYTQGMTPIQLVIIDEAAQLKECESCIPLQLLGLQHVILVGDEKQLPAMVQSKLCVKANFGRSLFERLATLGHRKHLLNVQYRMHPSISLFPNVQFYGKRIRDGTNVVQSSYKRSYLNGSIFGSYSFIDVTSGIEEFDDRHSRKNMVEVHVLAEIISSLHKESLTSKEKVRVGCISPYKAQIKAIQERLGDTYSTDTKDKFSVNVKSVDGFQGGEEDLIIISTVRCNGNGSVGFLSNHQRTNVALTRAKFCLWILGNGATLSNSGSVWKELVRDAKQRGCFFNAWNNTSLAMAITHALAERGDLTSVFDTNSALFKTSKWKVHFSSEFRDSVKKYKELGIYEEVVSLVIKISIGWHPTHNVGALCNIGGISSQLMNWCEVTGSLKLIWTVEIVHESSTESQVIKIWDVLPRNEIPMLAKKIDILYGNYTYNQINRCLFVQIEGDLRVPMTWKLDVDKGGNPELDLTSKFSAISLDGAESSTPKHHIGRNAKFQPRNERIPKK